MPHSWTSFNFRNPKIVAVLSGPPSMPPPLPGPASVPVPRPRVSTMQKHSPDSDEGLFPFLLFLKRRPTRHTNPCGVMILQGPYSGQCARRRRVSLACCSHSVLNRSWSHDKSDLLSERIWYVNFTAVQSTSHCIPLGRLSKLSQAHTPPFDFRSVVSHPL